MNAGGMDHHSSMVPCLQVAFMACPSIMQDVQVVAALLQTTKQVQQAVRHVLAGQLALELQLQKLQLPECCCQWLGTNAGIVRSLELQIPSNSTAAGARRSAAVVAALELSLRHAAAAGSLTLQSLTLSGSMASPGVLQQLPALHLTQLCVDVSTSCSASIQAVAALSNLRRLHLQCAAAAAARDSALHPLAAGLQQLTHMKIGPVTPVQLRQLPPKLQQLHVTFMIGDNLEWRLQQLASWLPHHARIVTSLHLIQGDTRINQYAVLARVIAALAAAFQAACAAAAAAVAATGNLPAVEPVSSWQLQSCTLGIFEPVRGGDTPLLQHLPATSLQHLACTLDWSSAAQIEALGQLTALRTLSVLAACEERAVHYTDSDDLARHNGHTVLAPLSALQQLTFLRLEAVNMRQLTHLQLPQLEVVLTDHSVVNPQDELLPSHLRLEHLTGLTKVVLDEGPWALLSADSQLPAHLLELSYSSCHKNSMHESRFSVQPLLALTRLAKLRLVLREQTPSVLLQQRLSRLCSLSSLQDVSLAYAWSKRMSQARLEDLHCSAAGIAAAWRALPLTELHWSSCEVPAAVVQQIGALTGLTHLALGSCPGQYGHLQATHAELALALAQLTGLRRLSIQDFKSMTAVPSCGDYVVAVLDAAGLTAAHLYAAEVACAVDALDCDAARCVRLCHGCGGAALLLQAIGNLHAVRQVHVVLPVQLSLARSGAGRGAEAGKEMQTMQTMQEVLQQVLPKRLQTCLEVTSRQVVVEL